MNGKKPVKKLPYPAPMKRVDHIQLAIKANKKLVETSVTASASRLNVQLLTEIRTHTGKLKLHNYVPSSRISQSFVS